MVVVVVVVVYCFSLASANENTHNFLFLRKLNVAAEEATLTIGYTAAAAAQFWHITATRCSGCIPSGWLKTRQHMMTAAFASSEPISLA